MREIYTFHGILGMIRMLLSPVIFYLILVGESLTAGIIFFIAASTDIIDRILIFPTLLALIIRGISLLSLYLILIYVVAEALIGIVMTVKRKKFYLFHEHRISARINVIVVLLVMGVNIIAKDYEPLLAMVVSPFLIYFGIDYFIHYAKRNV